MFIDGGRCCLFNAVCVSCLMVQCFCVCLLLAVVLFDITLVLFL